MRQFIIGILIGIIVMLFLYALYLATEDKSTEFKIPSDCEIIEESLDYNLLTKKVQCPESIYRCFSTPNGVSCLEVKEELK